MSKISYKFDIGSLVKEAPKMLLMEKGYGIVIERMPDKVLMMNIYVVLWNGKKRILYFEDEIVGIS